MQRVISSTELAKYLSTLSDQSDDFKQFLKQYVTGSIWVRSRGEEDISVWGKLRGDELDVAKKIIINELDIVPDSSYIRAVGYFRDPQAVPVLKKIAQDLPAEYLAEKLLAAKVLYDWIGYVNYQSMLETACKNSKGIYLDYLKISINEYTRGLSNEMKEQIISLLYANHG
jgi:hypothetical protein